VRKKQYPESSERGAVIIEGALVLLTLFTFIFAILETGRFFNVQNVLTNAAREGARLAVTPLSGGTSTLPADSDIQNRVNIFLQSSSIESGSTTINNGNGMGSPIVIDGGEFTNVEVSVPYSFLSLPLLGNILNVTLKGESLMRNETSP
jgi:TadE-like protein